MRLLAKLRIYRRVYARADRSPGFLRLLRKRRALMFAVSTFETAILVSDSVEMRLKTLAQLKTASLVGCPF